MIIFDSELAGFCVRFSGLLFYKYVESVIFLDSSMVEHAAVNRGVVGSSPTRGAFNYMRLHGQAVKTSPFHGGNTGSIPVGVTKEVDKGMPMWLNWQSS